MERYCNNGTLHNKDHSTGTPVDRNGHCTCFEIAHFRIYFSKQVFDVQGRAKERELCLMKEVPPGPIGCASAALS